MSAVPGTATTGPNVVGRRPIGGVLREGGVMAEIGGGGEPKGFSLSLRCSMNEGALFNLSILLLWLDLG